ncbi:MAG: hypothetical protein JRF71_00380 [Deltaproteobacteria bacterium]|nr:hypothetical protein [Deltaproteobacteria bacterium]MBW2539563.1 hypothetical protein [Deltaproteobacteria bacterium]
MTFYLLTIGFISILGQVVIIRELNVAFYGVELIYILAMGIWLFWSAIGALVGRRTFVPSPTAVKLLFVIFSVLLPMDVAFIRGIRPLFGGVPGAYLPFGKQLVGIFVALLPVGILMGLIFQWAAKIYIDANPKNRTLAIAYAVESIGGVLGGLTSTLLLQFGLQNFTISILCSLIAVGILLLPDKNWKDRVRYMGMFTFAILLFLLWLSPEMDQRMTRWNHPNLIVSRDSPYSRITIEGQRGQFVVFENDALSFETEGTAAEEFVHLAAIQHENPKRVLISGGGVEGIVGEIVKHAPRSVDYVELNAVLIDLADKHLPPSDQKSLRSQVVNVFHGDPRNFLASANRYDLILSGMPAPASGQSNRFYTREYFRQCADKLKPGGVFAFRLPSSENLWTKFLSYRNTSIYLALKSVFQDALVLPGVTNTILASNEPLSREPRTLIKRLNGRKVKTRFITPEYVNYLYTNDRFFEIEKRLASTKAPPNTDIRPVCYQYSSMIWLSKFIPQMINWDLSFFGASDFPWIYFYIVISIFWGGLFLLTRCWPRLKRIMLVAVAGFLGMVVATMLILYYQTKSGVLFQNIGILLMVFMAGLATGAMIITKVVNIHMHRYGLIRKRVGGGLLIGFGVLNLIFMGLLHTNYASGIFVVSLLLFAAGFLVSALFAFASLAGIKDQKIVVSPLYAADLLGGCVGSLLGSLIFIPFLGMGQSAGIMIVFALAALLLI